MLVYFDAVSGAVLFTIEEAIGVPVPAGASIEVAFQDLGDLAQWRVEGGALVARPVDPIADAPQLSPAQFEWLLAASGLDDVWAAVEAHLKATDRQAYANLRQNSRRGTYILPLTLAETAQVRPFVAQAFPSLDISDQVIIDLWAMAATK